MLLKNLDEKDALEFLNNLTPRTIQDLLSVNLKTDFKTISDHVIFNFDFELGGLKTGYLDYVVNEKITLQYFQTLKETPFLKRNGLYDGRDKLNSYNLGLLCLATATNDLKGSYDSKKIIFSKPFSVLGEKFFQGLGVELTKRQSFKDYSSIIFKEANKRGFDF